MSTYVDEAGRDLVLWFKAMTPEQRKELIGALSDGICDECWRDDPRHRCQCWNDE